MLNRLNQYDWRNFNYSLVIIVIILCMISAFTLKLAGGVEKGAGYMRGQLIGMDRITDAAGIWCYCDTA